MIKYIPTYENFLNEMIPNTLVDYNLSNMDWKKDVDLGNKLKGDRDYIEKSFCYVTENKEIGNKYVFFSWIDTNFFVIELTENGNSIFYEKYPKEEKNDFNLDCMDILGFKIKTTE